jgi:hypothetical protein
MNKEFTYVLFGVVCGLIVTYVAFFLNNKNIPAVMATSVVLTVISITCFILSYITHRKKKAPLKKLINVPYNNQRFTGREEIIKRLHKRLKAGKRTALIPVQAIKGLGGIGKTRTAVEYAHRYKNRYKKIMWVKAETQESITSDFFKIAVELGLVKEDEKEQKSAVTYVMDWLEKNNNWLLILENADTPGLVKGCIPHNTKGAVLITSRNRELDALMVEDPVELGNMEDDEARDFLKKYAVKKCPDKTDMETIDDIAKELDYFPLALEQARAYIKMTGCSFKDYLYRYKISGLELLRRKGPVTGGYTESVRTTWLMNFEKIEERERTGKAAYDILRVSAFLDTGAIPFEIFTLGADKLGENISKAILNDDPAALDDLLALLAQYSLIRTDNDSRTYNIHRLVQAVIKDRMTGDERKTWAERAVKGMNSAFPEPDSKNWQLCEKLMPHVLALFELIDKYGLYFEETVRLLNQAGLYLNQRARCLEAEEYKACADEIREKHAP